MTEVLAGIESEKAVRSGSPATNVLRVLCGIAEGEVGSTREISGVYNDVKRLMTRLSRLNGLGTELDIQPSSYLVHLNKMREIEEGLAG
jgi:hypothetical protein